MKAKNSYPKICSAILRQLSMRPNDVYVGVRADFYEVRVQVDDQSFLVPGDVEFSNDVEAAVRKIIFEVLGEDPRG